MKVKKIIAVICLTVLTTQVIPLRQIGAMLFNNQITEEIAHGSDYGKKPLEEKEVHTWFPSLFASQTQTLAGTNNHSIYAHAPLVQLHIAEVPTPPPNI
ncbi:hypothetical protein [Parafilimonas sp.]|uniref:hypothetical protein n=1 Tax=Parafilimonas sp. TaxID=1969739 RepID=UPI0039E3C435